MYLVTILAMLALIPEMLARIPEALFSLCGTTDMLEGFNSILIG